jgi:hypothetical protein
MLGQNDIFGSWTKLNGLKQKLNAISIS